MPKIATGPMLILVVFLLVCTAHASVIYVSTNGAHIPPFDSPAKASTNVHDAIDACGVYDEIEIGPGVFVLTNALEITMPLWIKGASGSEKTILSGAPLELMYADVLVQDITIQNSYSYGARFSADAIMERCSIRLNGNGGVSFDGAGLLINSTVYSNVVAGGYASARGVLYMVGGGKAINCLICDNYGVCMYGDYTRAGGAYLDGGGTLQNCTIVGNDAGAIMHRPNYPLPSYYTYNSGSGVYCTNGGMIKNCVIWQNKSFLKGDGDSLGPEDNWFFEGTNPVVRNTCSWPLIPGAGNMDSDPLFMDLPTCDLRMRPLSPCIDSGYSKMLFYTDQDVAGYSRIVGTEIDMGAYEVGPLIGIVEPGEYQHPIPISFLFKAQVISADLDGLTVDWDFNGDGTYDYSGKAALTVTNNYDYAGDFTVKCRFRNSAGEEYVATCPSVVRTCYSSVQYVSPNGSHIWPYNTWGTAATNIQAAVDVAARSTVMLDDGVYLIQETLMITNPMTISSRNGAEHTLVRMATNNRCIYLNYQGSVVEKLTVQNGFHNESGAGVWCGPNTVLRNCVIESNCVSGGGDTFGGGVYGASRSVVDGCTIRDNIVNSAGGDSYGGGYFGTEDALLTNCVILRNIAETTKYTGYWGYSCAGLTAKGGGCAVSNALVINCHIETNQCRGQSGCLGGGLYMDGGSAKEVILCGNDSKGVYVPIYPPKYWSSYFVPGDGGGGYVINGAELEYGTIISNISMRGAGLFVKDAQVKHFSIYKNSATSIVVNYSNVDGSGGGLFINGNVRMDNCQIYLNESSTGGGLMINTGCVDMANSTIANNKACGGAGIFNAMGTGQVANSIVYYNRNSPETNVEIDDAGGRLLLQNCCYRSASVEGIDCITNAPLFVDWLPLYEDDNQFRPQAW